MPNNKRVSEAEWAWAGSGWGAGGARVGREWDAGGARVGGAWVGRGTGGHVPDVDETTRKALTREADMRYDKATTGTAA